MAAAALGIADTDMTLSRGAEGPCLPLSLNLPLKPPGRQEEGIQPNWLSLWVLNQAMLVNTITNHRLQPVSWGRSDRSAEPSPPGSSSLLAYHLGLTLLFAQKARLSRQWLPCAEWDTREAASPLHACSPCPL